MQSSELKEQFDEQLSQLLRTYKHKGLSYTRMADSLDWHLELAQSRSNGHTDRSNDNHQSQQRNRS